MANRILVDTGFWYAVFNKQDCHTGEAEILMDKYFDKPAYEIFVPFPTMYELLRTIFVSLKVKRKLIYAKDFTARQRDARFSYTKTCSACQ